MALDEPSLTIREAAQATGLSVKALRRRLERGSLASVLTDGRRRIPVAELLAAGLLVTDPSARPTQASAPSPARGDETALLDRLERQARELGELTAAVAMERQALAESRTEVERLKARVAALERMR